MKQHSNSPNPRPEPVRKSVLVIVLVAIVGLGALGYFRVRPHSENAVETLPATEADSPAPATPSEARSLLTRPRGTEASDAVGRSVVPEAPPPIAAPLKVPVLPAALASGPPGSPYTRDLVNSIAKLDLSRGEISPEQATAWRQSLTNLVSRGAESVPAIREFLAQNLDLNLDSVKGADQLGAHSARLAILQTLQNIGGPEAMALSSATLQVSRDPREIAYLASALEQQAPEQYRELAVGSAREALALAQSDPAKYQGRDVGPLFDVLKQFGGAAAVADLANATDKWKYYSLITLSQLPDGAGAAALLDMAQNKSDRTTGNRAFALEIMAQDAWKNPQIVDVLIDQVKSGGVPLSTLYTISSLLSGERYQLGLESAPGTGEIKHTYHLQYGNQQYSTYASPMSPDQIRGNIAIIDRYLASSPDASMAEVFRETKATLEGRLVPAPAGQ